MTTVLFHRLKIAAGMLAFLGTCVFSNETHGEDFNTWSEKPAADILPKISNAVTVVRIKQLLASPWALAEGEAARREQLYELGEAVIPPWVDSVTISSLLRPSEEGTAIKAIVADLRADAPVLPRQDAPDVDFGDAAVLETKRDAIFVGRAGGRVVGWSPASRTEFVHWVDGSFANGLSSPLRTMIGHEEPEVVLGLDLKGLVSRAAAQARLASDAQFDDALDRAVELLVDAKSVSCTVNATDTLECTITIFGSGNRAYVESDATILKSLFLAILGDTGYSLPEFDNFDAIAGRHSCIMTGVLSDDSLTALTSLGVPKLPRGDQLFGEEKKTDARRERREKRTSPLDDFNRAATMIESLDRRQRRAKDPSSVASWCDRTAGELDDLSVATADETVSGFASRSASSLRAIGSSLRGLKAKLNAEQESVTYDVRVNPGWSSVNIWGGVGYRPPSARVDTNLREVRERQARMARESADDRESIWNSVQEDIARTRRSLLGAPQN